MANSYYSVYEHIVFSTKHREPWLNPEISPEPHQYLGGSINQQECHSLWDLEKIRSYILNQERHHQRMSWETKFRKLLIKHGETFDERYSLD